MNFDNKYSSCCGCPAVTDITREFTVYSSSRLYNFETMKKTKTTNAHDYRASLQLNGDKIIKNTNADFDKNFKCKNNGQNIFYLDSSKYNAYYENINAISSKPQIENYHYGSAKGSTLDSMKNNMSLSSISLAPLVSRTTSNF